MLDLSNCRCDGKALGEIKKVIEIVTREMSWYN